MNPLLVPTLIGSAALFWLGLVLQKKFSARPGGSVLWVSTVVLACPGLLYGLYYAHMFDNAAWFYNLRAVPYTELLAWRPGLTAGVLQSWWEPENFGEKLVAPVLLFVLTLVPFVKPLLDPLAMSKLKDRCEGEVCWQSSFSTCGPASATTLLRSFRKIASEKELAQDRFTSRGGTEIWYLAPALGKRGVRTSVVIRPGADTGVPSPAIAGVVLAGNAGHYIAILNADQERITIADPLKGKLVVARADLPTYYRFTGFFLVLRIQQPRWPWSAFKKAHFADPAIRSLEFFPFAKESILYSLFPSGPDLDAALCIQLPRLNLRPGSVLTPSIRASIPAWISTSTRAATGSRNSEIPPDQMKLAVSSGCLRVEGFDLAALNVKNAPSSASHQREEGCSDPEVKGTLLTIE